MVRDDGVAPATITERGQGGDDIVIDDPTIRAGVATTGPACGVRCRLGGDAETDAGIHEELLDGAPPLIGRRDLWMGDVGSVPGKPSSKERHNIVPRDRAVRQTVAE